MYIRTSIVGGHRSGIMQGIDGDKDGGRKKVGIWTGKGAKVGVGGLGLQCHKSYKGHRSYRGIPLR